MSIESVVTLSGPYGQQFNKVLRAMNFIAKTITEGSIVSVGAQGGWMDFALAVDATRPVLAVGALNNTEQSLWAANRLELSLVDRVSRADDAEQGGIGMLWIDGSLSDTDQRAALLDYLPVMLDGGFVGVSTGGLRPLQDVATDYDLQQVEFGDGYYLLQFHTQEETEEIMKSAPVVVTKPQVTKPAPKPAVKPATKTTAKPKKKPTTRKPARKTTSSKK